MDVPILGGGVILAIAAVLWLVYLVPSWYSRGRFNATERNAVRLSQALRILAETSENPTEMNLELDARTAYEQSKLARRAEAERVRVERDRVRDEADRRRELERIRVTQEQEVARIASAAERDRVAAEAELAREEAMAAAAAERRDLARRRAEAAEALRLSGVAQARARRRLRASATVVLLLGLLIAAAGVWLQLTFAQPWALLGGAVAAVVALGVLQKMSGVARRARRRVVPMAAPVEVVAEPRREWVLHDEPAPRWTPRQLPNPLSNVAGSRAAVAQDRIDAHAALRRVALEEAARQKAEQDAPVRIDTARPAARAEEASPFTRMGYIDDEAVEAHVRDLLARRAAS
ncbi:hypothetical protein [Microbacterium gorillae]|uniref:hypothetical protein n=1 Tax=Microbacterium gorillae TaxID=1231063 RepID=UPI00058E5ACA|nr:hypothetical protein [Microbacterium gorillae]